MSANTIDNVYGVSLSGDEATLEDAQDWARGFVWSECECSTQDISHVRYEDTVDGIDIYYCYGTDDYLFADTQKG